MTEEAPAVIGAGLVSGGCEPPMPAPPPKRTPGELIILLDTVREERRAMAERDKLLEAQWRALEYELILVLDEQGMKRVSSDVATATITTENVPNVTDWDAFFDYMKETDSLHLLQRRVATRAWRELHDSGQPVPGIDPFAKRTISLRKV